MWSGNKFKNSPAEKWSTREKLIKPSLNTKNKPKKYDPPEKRTRPQLIENQMANSQKKGTQTGNFSEKKTSKMFWVKVNLGQSSSLNEPQLLRNRETATRILKSNREKTIEKLKKYRPRMNQKKRRIILRLHPWFSRLFNCSSKTNLISVLSVLPGPYRNFVKLYLRRFFLMHVHLRQIKNLFQLMSHRQSIYNAVDQPEILRGNMKFKNNMVKNFCKGVVNFVVLFYEDLQEIHFLSPTRKLRFN